MFSTCQGPLVGGVRTVAQAGLELAVWPQVTLALSTLASSSAVHRRAAMSTSHAFLPVSGCEPQAYGGPGGHVSLLCGGHL